MSMSTGCLVRRSRSFAVFVVDVVGGAGGWEEVARGSIR
jgi:hypothetical protein